jgi:dolichyl-phosphate-mannose--protein O-mannosyl transferase
LLVAVAGTLRFHGLGVPERIYFDEVYYANQARDVLAQGVEREFVVHPPVGKWLIAAGIGVFGFDGFGWRATSALAGTLTVLVLYLVGLRLFRLRGIAALAALLLAVDGLAFTMSRIAMLDSFLSLFVVLGFWLLLLDRDRQWAGLPSADPPGSELPGSSDDSRPRLPRRPHPYRWLAGIALGLALATKWSGLLAIASAGLFVLASDMLWRRRLGARPWDQAGRLLAGSVLPLLVVPLLVYLMSYGSWFANFPSTQPGIQSCPQAVCDISVPGAVRAWWDEQLQIARFHRDLEADHPYRAPATTWPFLRRPVALYYEACPDERMAEGTCVVAPPNVAEILAIGNPGVWWAALAAYPVLLWFAAVHRDWRVGAILAFLLGQTLPWLGASRPVFLFYMTPVVPFMCLALGYTAWRSVDHRLLRWVPSVIAGMAVAAFLFWYPLYVAQEIPKSAWDLRIWLRSWI